MVDILRDYKTFTNFTTFYTKFAINYKIYKMVNNGF